MELARPPLGAVRRLADLPAERQPSEARELGERRSDAPEFSSQTRVPCKGQGMHEKIRNAEQVFSGYPDDCLAPSF